MESLLGAGAVTHPTPATSHNRTATDAFPGNRESDLRRLGFSFSSYLYSPATFIVPALTSLHVCFRPRRLAYVVVHFPSKHTHRTWRR